MRETEESRLPTPEVRRAMRLSIAEGIAWAVMLGSAEVYFLADGVRLGAGPLGLALLVTLPLCLGALGPLAVLGALSRWPRRRAVATLAGGAQALVLLGLAALDAWGRLTPALLVGLVCAYQVFGQGAGVAWASWYGDLVPEELRGRYFSRRGRWVHFATFIAVIAAGLILHRLEPGAPGTATAGAGGHGYAVVYGLAAAARLVSCLLLAAAPEAELGSIASGAEAVRLLRSPEGRPIRRLLLAAVALMVLVYTASPFFNVFMLQELEFTYFEFTLASTVVLVAKWLALPMWGRAVDRQGARSIYIIALFLIALVPLPWLVARGMGLVILGMALSGLAWGGHEIAHFSLLLETATSRIRPALFAVTNLAAGAAQLVGSLVGGAVLEATGARFRLLFGLSLGVRLLLALAASRMLPPTIGRPGRRPPGLIFRLIGLRSHGGLAARPHVVEHGEVEEVSAAPSAADGGPGAEAR